MVTGRRSRRHRRCSQCRLDVLVSPVRRNSSRAEINKSSISRPTKRFPEMASSSRANFPAGPTAPVSVAAAARASTASLTAALSSASSSASGCITLDDDVDRDFLTGLDNVITTRRLNIAELIGVNRAPQCPEEHQGRGYNRRGPKSLSNQSQNCVSSLLVKPVCGAEAHLLFHLLSVPGVLQGLCPPRRPRPRIAAATPRTGPSDDPPGISAYPSF